MSIRRRLGVAATLSLLGTRSSTGSRRRLMPRGRSIQLAFPPVRESNFPTLLLFNILRFPDSYVLAGDVISKCVAKLPNG